MMMNNVTPSADVSVVHIMMSEENFANMWLHVLLLVMVMVVGVPGNCLVLAVFFRSLRRGKRRRDRFYNSTQLLVLSLALSDLVVCLLLLPFDLYRLRHYFSFRSESACDVFEYLRNATIAFSCLLLTCTAVERYRAIGSDLFDPTGQGRRGPTVILLHVLFVFSLLLSSPTPHFLGVQARTVPTMLVAHFSAEVRETYRQFSDRALMFTCEYQDAYDHTWGLRLFGLSTLLIFLAVVVVSIGAYGKIYLRIKTNHGSLHTAMNKVAPIPPARGGQEAQADGTEGMDDGPPLHTTPTTATHSTGGERRLHLHHSSPRSREADLSNTRPSHRRTPVGIFTVSDSQGGGLLRSPAPQPSVDSGTASVSRSGRLSQEGTCPRRLIPDGLKGVSAVPLPRKLPPEVITDTALCSDERDIDVTVKNKDDDVTSADQEEMSRTVLADVLSELQSVTENSDGEDDEDTERRRTGVVPRDSTNTTSDHTSGVGTCHQPKHNNRDCESRTSHNVQCCRPHATRGSQTDPCGRRLIYNIFTLSSGEASGSDLTDDCASAKQNLTRKRESKPNKGGLFKRGRWNNSPRRALMSDVDRRVYPAGICSSRTKKRGDETGTAVRGSVHNGRHEPPECEATAPTSSPQPLDDLVTLSQDCRKHTTSSTAQNCPKHKTATATPANSGDSDEHVTSTHTQDQECDKKLTSRITQISEKRTTSETTQDFDIHGTTMTTQGVEGHVTSQTLLMSCQGSVGRDPDTSSFLKPEFVINSSRAESQVPSPGGQRPRTTTCDQSEACPAEPTPSLCDTSAPAKSLYSTVAEQMNTVTSSIKLSPECEIRVSSSTTTDLVRRARSKPKATETMITATDSCRHASTRGEPYVLTESATCTVEHPQQSKRRNKQATPESMETWGNLKRQTMSVEIQNSTSVTQQTAKVEIHSSYLGNTPAATSKGAESKTTQTTSFTVLGDSLVQNKRGALRIQNSSENAQAASKTNSQTTSFSNFLADSHSKERTSTTIGKDWHSKDSGTGSSVRRIVADSSRSKETTPRTTRLVLPTDPHHHHHRRRGGGISSAPKTHAAAVALQRTAPTRMDISQTARFARQIRVAKILVAVTGAFLASFVPFWALTVVYMVSPHLDWRLSAPRRMVLSTLYQSYFLNSAVNPVLFALYSPQFRAECRLMVHDLRKKFCACA